MSKKNDGITTLGLRRADFGFFKDLLVRTSWVTALGGKEAQKSWLVFMDYLLKTQEQSVGRKQSKCSRRPVWMDREFLVEVGHRK